MQIVVIGLGLFGSAVAEALVQSGEDVLAVDSVESIVQETVDRGIVTHAACIDATVRTNLERLGVSADYDVGVVGIGTQVEASIVATIHLKDLGVPHVLSKALHETHKKILHKVGADQVLIPEVTSGEEAARTIINPNVLDELRLSEDFSILEVVAPSPLTGRSLAESNLRAEFGVTVIGYKRGGEASFNPSADFVIEPGDVLVIGISRKHRNRFLDLEGSSK